MHQLQIKLHLYLLKIHKFVYLNTFLIYLEVYEYQKGYDDYEHYGTESVYLGAYAATGNAVDVDGKILYAVCCEPAHHEVIKAQGEGQNEA